MNNETNNNFNPLTGERLNQNSNNQEDKVENLFEQNKQNDINYNQNATNNNIILEKNAQNFSATMSQAMNEMENNTQSNYNNQMNSNMQPNQTSNYNTMSGMPIYNNQTSPMNNNVQNNLNGQINFNPSINSQYNGQMNFGNNYGPQNNKKNKTMIFIIIGIIVAVLLGAGVLLIPKLTEDEKTIQEYEEQNPIERPNEQEEIVTNDSTIKFKGFEFTKVNGYTYQEKNEQLLVLNNTFIVALDIVKGDFNSIKTPEIKNKMKEQYTNYGYTVGKIGVENISGKELFVMEITQSGKNVLFYIHELNENGYLIGGAIYNKQNTFDHNNLSEAINITKNSKYVESGSNYSSSFSKDFNLKEFE